MAKKYFGYVEIIGRNNTVSSAAVGEFDPDNIRIRTRGPNDSKIMIQPNKVYFSIDNVDSDNPKFRTSGNEEWEVSKGDIHTTLVDAWKQIYINKSIIFKEIFDRPIH